MTDQTPREPRTAELELERASLMGKIKLGYRSGSTNDGGRDLLFARVEEIDRLIAAQAFAANKPT